MTDIGDYRVIKKLGEGTFAEVLQAKNKRSGKIYALKRFKKQFRSVDEIESLREIQALRRLNLHPNIIQLEEVIFDAKYGILSLSFELMDYNLYDVLSKKGAPPVHEHRAKWIMWQVIKAMDFVHGKGVFHRDIKPENILVRGDVHSVPLPFPSMDPQSPHRSISSFPLVKLADFGSCRGVHSRMPYTEYIATRWYRSPECLLFDGVYTYKMDIWGIGCVLHEVITKQPLFPGDNELDQLHKIHQVLGSPSDRLLKSMVTSGTQSLMSAPNGQTNPKAAGHLQKGIFKKQFSFPQTRGCGIKAVFPQHVLQGAHKVPFPKSSSYSHAQAADYPGISDSCIGLIELLLQYDPDSRPSARQVLKHSWLKECRDAETLERHINTSTKELSIDTSTIVPTESLIGAPSLPPIAVSSKAGNTTSPRATLPQAKNMADSSSEQQQHSQYVRKGSKASSDSSTQGTIVAESLISPKQRKIPAKPTAVATKGLDSHLANLSITSPKVPVAVPLDSSPTRRLPIKKNSLPPVPAILDSKSPGAVESKSPHEKNVGTTATYIVDSSMTGQKASENSTLPRASQATEVQQNHIQQNKADDRMLAHAIANATQ